MCEFSAIQRGRIRQRFVAEIPVKAGIYEHGFPPKACGNDKKEDMGKTLKSIGEFALIDRLRKVFPAGKDVICGIGDDAAVYSASKNRYQLLAIDTIVEDIDFEIRKIPPEMIGRKALAINLSDIAAMGGIPKIAVVSLVLPAKTQVQFIERFADGLKKLAKQYNVSIVGGDLSRGPCLCATVAITGEIDPGHVILRKGSKPGDLIFVTGSLGGSILGKHFQLTPRVAEGQFLSEFGISAMIDISDGLIQDLNHLISGNRLGYVLYERKIPISEAAKRLSRKDRKSGLHHAFYDGEDFELLFTVARKKKEQLERLWKRLFCTPLTHIGEVVENSRSKPYLIKKAGYQHF